MTIAQKVIAKLKAKGKTVSLAESCTGGMIAQTLTSVSGASEVFSYGVVSYSANAKKAFLNVPLQLCKKKGEVSKEVALAMAKGIKRISKSDISIAVTGVAGPTGGSPKKPVGTVYISLISNSASHIKKVHLSGSRTRIRKRTTEIALHWLYKIL
jgi:PncC family amidohydrolase